MKAYYHSPVGILELTEEDGYLCALRIIDNTTSKMTTTSEILDEAIKQLEEYFAGERKIFELPLRHTGTDFQLKAWEYLKNIPYGQTVTYKDQAEAIGSPNGARATGSANGKNSIAIIVPCHRVVNHGGGLGGYAYGMDVKAKLLALELKHRDI